MSSSNCCFLTCTQISQEAGQVVWYSHLFQNFPQFIVIHIVKDFGIINKEEIDLFGTLHSNGYISPFLFYLYLLFFFSAICKPSSDNHLCMKCSLGISNFLEVISSLSQSVVFLYFFALITEEGFLISLCYSMELCIQMGISFLFTFCLLLLSFHQLFVRLPQTTILPEAHTEY